MVYNNPVEDVHGEFRFLNCAFFAQNLWETISSSSQLENLVARKKDDCRC